MVDHHGVLHQAVGGRMSRRTLNNSVERLEKEKKIGHTI
jgi:hypothetical protein